MGVTNVICGLVVLACVFSSCEKKKSTATDSIPAIPPAIDFFDHRELCNPFPNDIRSFLFRNNDGELLLFSSARNKLLLAISSDSGISWHAPQTVIESSDEIVPLFTRGDWCGVVVRKIKHFGSQLFFSARYATGLTPLSRLRDTEWGVAQIPAVARDAEGNLFCAWIDHRNGNADLYFARSTDGGASWSRNVRINDDQTGQEQVSPNLLRAEDGTLYAIWSDNRNPKTLYDIYYASSTDGGNHWSRNQLVSDDPEAHFQFQPSAMIDSLGRLHCVWVDYRLKGETDDVTSNIFYAHFDVQKKTWQKNQPVTHAKIGHNGTPSLVLESPEMLHCFWHSTERNPNRDLCYAYTTNSGQTWSEQSYINPSDPQLALQGITAVWFGRNERDESLVISRKSQGDQAQIFFSRGRKMEQRVEQHPTSEPRSPNVRSYIPFEYRMGETLFEDTSTSEQTNEWRVHSGYAKRTPSAMILYGDQEANCFAGNNSWRDYAIEGAFKLDSIEHKTAYIYFRAQVESSSERYYRLSNFFREGARLDYWDGARMRLLSFTPYSFQKNRWYAFRSVVLGNRLQHFIDDSLLIRTDTLLQLHRGKIGIGAALFPTFFQRIRVHEVY